MSRPAPRPATPSARTPARLAVALWLAIASGVLAPPVLAADRAGSVAQEGPAWHSLTRQQQAALAPLQQEWHRIDAGRKAKWIEVAGRFPAMPLEEQARVQERMADWARMSPSDRGRARAGFQELRQLPPSDRQAAWEAYRALPPERRDALARQQRSSDPGSKASSRAGERDPRDLRPATPTDIQGSAGATTRLVNRPPALPPHQQSGLPKVAGTPGFVDPQTLLPQRGAQGAAALRPSPRASEPARKR